MIEQNFEKLEELIKDDDKIATVASFAVEAHITIAESKETLEKYVEINKGSKDIRTTYILNGKKKGKDNLTVSLVKDNNLKEEKECYEESVKQIIFSIQKAENLDFNVIALVDPVRTSIEDSILGAIISPNCIKRSLLKKVLPTLPPATIKGKSTIFTKQNSTVKSDTVKVERDGGDSNQSKNKTNTQGNIASLFSKAAQNKKPEQKDVKQPEKKQKTNGGLTDFFTKQSSKELSNEFKKEKQEQKEIKSESKGDDDTDDEILKDLEIIEDPPSKKVSQKENKQAENGQNEKEDKKSDLFDSDTDDEIMKDLEIKEEKPINKKIEKKQDILKTKNKNSQKKKRGVKDVGNDKSVKKRKRIIIEDDSDSDDIFASETSDHEDLVESDKEPVKVEKKPLPPKNKRRKAVEKIYEDEEGYIVTKTEYIYETPSEDENEPENKMLKIEEKPKPKIQKKGSSNSENDISPNKGTKSKKGGNKKASSGNQPTLMNFFKKK